MNKKFFYKRGFSLIELMVVIAIIGILTAIVITNIYSSRGKSRDAKRISDIAQIQLALEQYFDKCREYPATLSLNANNCMDGVSTTFGAYISVIPKDPLTGSNYGYGVDTNKLDYVLRADLEFTNAATADGLTSSDIYGQADCNSATDIYCVGPK